MVIPAVSKPLNAIRVKRGEAGSCYVRFAAFAFLGSWPREIYNAVTFIRFVLITLGRNCHCRTAPSLKVRC